MALLIPKAFYNPEVKKALAARPLIRGFTSSDEQAVDVETADDDQVQRLDLSWLPFAAQTYKISPHIESYIIKNMPICPSDLPNRNGVSFPIQELVKYQPPPISRQVYKAWSGCPVHLEHDNEDCTKALGVILDTALVPIKGYGNGKHWNVMGLIAIDKDKYPDIAQDVLSNKINTGSMGAMADSFSCGVCGHEAGEKSFLNCAHISSTKNVNWKIIDYMGHKTVAFLKAHGLSPIEYSMVRDPAWAPALSDTFINW